MQRHDFGSTTSVRTAELDETTGVVAVTMSDGSVNKHANFTAERFAVWQADAKPGQWYATNVKKRPDLYPVVKDETAAPTTPEPAPAPPVVERGVARVASVEVAPSSPAPAKPADKSTERSGDKNKRALARANGR